MGVSVATHRAYLSRIFRECPRGNVPVGSFALPPGGGAKFSCTSHGHIGLLHSPYSCERF